MRNKKNMEIGDLFIFMGDKIIKRKLINEKKNKWRKDKNEK